MAPEDWYYVKYYRKMPVSCGFEIEQWSGNITRRVRTIYDWHIDGSGPLETTLGPALYPGREIHSFLRNIGADRWKWTGELPPEAENRGCGSHIHFRVREELAVDVLQAWTCLYNTMIEVFPILLPLVSAFTMKPLRREAGEWAKAVTLRYTPVRMARFLRYDFDGREYHYVTPNKHAAKPLTLEMRLNEAHPSLAYCTAILINRIARKCFDRRFQSPKLADRRRVLTDWMQHVYQKCAYLDWETAYEYLEQNRDIRFTRPIPLLDREYPNMLAVFQDILRKYIPRYPPLARVGRLAMNKGDPAHNPNSIWNIWVPYGQFAWEEGPRSP